jgi:hypothetical protein
MKPEEQARQTIDELLRQAGWVVQDYARLNLGASLGIAVREFPLATGAADYLLLVDREAVGAIYTTRRIVTTGRRASVSTSSPSMNCSNATSSASTYSGCVTRASKVPIRSCHKMCLPPALSRICRQRWSSSVLSPKM